MALEFLGANAALHTPEWAAWRARMRSPKLAGRWLVTARLAGRGNYFGEMTVEPGAAEDEFKTQIRLKSIQDGSTLTRSGNGLVYVRILAFQFGFQPGCCHVGVFLQIPIQLRYVFERG